MTKSNTEKNTKNIYNLVRVRDEIRKYWSLWLPAFMLSIKDQATAHLLVDLWLVEKINKIFYFTWDKSRLNAIYKIKFKKSLEI